MIYTRVVGGLGNQMFQYAAGRSLSLRNTTELVLDTSWFDKNDQHQGFELARVFRIGSSCFESLAMERILGWGRSHCPRRFWKRLPSWFFGAPTYVAEPHFNYWPGWDFVSDDAYLDGYWQSQKYFVQYEEEIRKDFSFRQNLNERSHRLAEEISNCNAVSMHVRRGDYVSNPKANAVHGLCTADYYAAGIRHIQQHVTNMRLYIFSDEIDWVRENMPLDDNRCVYIDHNKFEDSWQDMKLMSLCQHNIIANSSFSWWGAWLNPHPFKKVIAPSQWFKDSSKKTKDLYPSEWIVL